MPPHATYPLLMILIPDDAVGQRLDNFLLSRRRDIPKTRWYRAIRKGEVRIHGKRKSPDYRLQQGDVCRVPPWSIQEQVELILPDWPLSDWCIYEDADYLIFDKPSGIPAHAGGGKPYGLSEVVAHQYPGAKPVHRLDRGTSGCMAFAKHREGLNTMVKAFGQCEVKKVYWLLVLGDWSGGVVNEPLALIEGASPDGPKMQVHEGGVHAHTSFRRLAYQEGISLLEAQIQTGRTHQIRVHAASRGYPLLGDRRYGGAEWPGRRLALHARSLTFTPKLKSGLSHIQAALPERFGEWFC